MRGLRKEDNDRFEAFREKAIAALDDAVETVTIPRKQWEATVVKSALRGAALVDLGYPNASTR